jgi:hypothetical protein
MATFTIAQISEKHGGDTTEYLPHVDGRVVCACLRLDYNPGAPGVILPGDDPDVQLWASVLCQQGGAIPVYIRHQADAWEYVGEYEVERSSQLPADIAEHPRAIHLAKIKVSRVIWMRKI